MFSSAASGRVMAKLIATAAKATAGKRTAVDEIRPPRVTLENYISARRAGQLRLGPYRAEPKVPMAGLSRLAMRRCPAAPRRSRGAGVSYRLGMEKLGPRAAFAGISLGLALVSFALAQRGSVEHQSFKAFYCAGTAVRERADPYRVEPLRSCERSLESSPMPSGYVEPAPLPGYVLAFFALLSALPAKVASELFVLILAAAAILSARALAAIVPAPSYAVLLALAPLTLLNVASGEIPPVALVAICVAAYLLRAGRPAAAGVAVSLALVQPNIGAPAVLALLVFAPGARLAIVGTSAGLAALSAIALGVGANVEYFT